MRTFEVPDSESHREFIKKHQKSCFENEDGTPKYLGAIGGGLTYRFTSTSIGDICTVMCYCGEEAMVSDDL